MFAWRSAAYVAPKTGLVRLTRSIAVDFERKGIRCNAISPGSIDTPMLRAAAERDPAGMQAQIDAAYAGRIGTPKEIAAACAFLLSDECSFVNGVDLLVDGARADSDYACAGMSDPPGPEALVDADPHARAYDAYSAFPRDARALLDRIVPRFGLYGELEPVRRAVATLAAVPLEASVSLRPGAPGALRFTFGIPPRPGDPDARLAMVRALTGLGAERVSTAIDEALAGVAPAPGHRRLVRALAFRVRSGEPPRLRAGAWVGGATTAERFARVADAMRRVGLDRTAALHERVTARLAANPFNAFVAYGLAFAVGPDRIEGTKTYFNCEWADVGTGLLSGLKDELRLDGVESFELLAESARADRRRARWLTEVGFELPADPALGARAKAYLLPASLAANEEEGHIAILRLAARLGLDPLPYEELVSAVRPDGLTPERPCSLMVGLSASARGPSLEIYVLNPGRRDLAASPPG